MELQNLVNWIVIFCFFQQFENKWEKPGNIEVHGQKRFISSHPGEDRDSDSEDEDTKQQLPIPIQEEPIEETSGTSTDGSQNVPEIERNDSIEVQETIIEESTNRDDITDTGEAENEC